MFVNIRSRMFVFLVGFLITCLRLQCFIKHLIRIKTVASSIKITCHNESCIGIFQ